MVRDYQLAEDLTHDTFIKAYKHYDSFKGQSKVKTWLFSVAHHVTIDHLRKRKPLAYLKEILPTPDLESLPEEVIELKEDSKELYEAIGKLKPSYRKVIMLRKIKEFSIKDTCAILNWSESRVKTTLYRALPALEKQLKKGGYSYEESVSKAQRRI